MIHFLRPGTKKEFGRVSYNVSICFNHSQRMQLNQNHCPGRKGIKAVAQPSVTSGRLQAFRSDMYITCQMSHTIQAFYEGIAATNTIDYIIIYDRIYIFIILYADQDIKFELRRPQATSKEVQDLFRRRDGENKEYTEYENDCIIISYIYTYSMYSHVLNNIWYSKTVSWCKSFDRKDPR